MRTLTSSITCNEKCVPHDGLLDENAEEVHNLHHNLHSISNRKFCCFSFIIAMVHQNSPTVEFLHEKIEGNLKRANTEPSVNFRRANTEPSVDFTKANMEPSVNFRRGNTETYWK